MSTQFDGWVNIHIGLGTAGSSELQAFFVHNSSALRDELGIEYLPVGLQSGHHFDLARSLGFGWPNTSFDHVPSFESANVQSSRLVVSSEHFSVQTSPEGVANLAEYFAPANCRVVVVYRSIPAWLRSMYGDSIRWGSTAEFPFFVDHHLEQAALAAPHRLWVEQFGSNVISLIREEIADVVPAVLSAMDCADAGPLWHTRDWLVDSSLSDTAAEVLRRHNVALEESGGGSAERYDQFVEFLGESSGQNEDSFALSFRAGQVDAIMGSTDDLVFELRLNGDIDAATAGRILDRAANELVDDESAGLRAEDGEEAVAKLSSDFDRYLKDTGLELAGSC